nr:B12-binding domain-containing protein [Halorhodospira abdelmalekii]
MYQAYLGALLRGERSRCVDLTKRLLEDDDVAVRDLYLDLFQRALYEVGHLWETNRISVATEHTATAITEGLLTLAYPKIFMSERKGKRALVSCMVNEYHQVGGKMVADIFELNGWDGYFAGGNTPVSDLLLEIEEKEPDILALSVSVYFNMGALYGALERIMKDHPELKIIVGGQAFQWGGSDIGQRYPGVDYVPSIHHLETLLKEYEH